MKRFISIKNQNKLEKNSDLDLPDFSENLETILGEGKSFQVDGTNVIRVPFGIRRPLKQRPEKLDTWATLILPFNPLGNPTPPPHAA